MSDYSAGSRDADPGPYTSTYVTGPGGSSLEGFDIGGEDISIITPYGYGFSFPLEDFEAFVEYWKGRKQAEEEQASTMSEICDRYDRTYSELIGARMAMAEAGELAAEAGLVNKRKEATRLLAQIDTLISTVWNKRED